MCRLCGGCDVGALGGGSKKFLDSCRPYSHDFLDPRGGMCRGVCSFRCHQSCWVFAPGQYHSHGDSGVKNLYPCQLCEGCAPDSFPWGDWAAGAAGRMKPACFADAN